MINFQRILNEDYEYLYSLFAYDSVAIKLIEIMGKEFVVRQWLLWALKYGDQGSSSKTVGISILKLVNAESVTGLGFWRDSPQKYSFWENVESLLHVSPNSQEYLRLIEVLWATAL